VELNVEQQQRGATGASFLIVSELVISRAMKQSAGIHWAASDLGILIPSENIKAASIIAILSSVTLPSGPWDISISLIAITLTLSGLGDAVFRQASFA
jgi:hypothetical protein